MSIELPVATRHRRDMTEKLLKAMLNPNSHTHHLFFCLPLLLAPFTVPYRIVFAMPEGLEKWPYHLSFRFFTMVRKSSCTPMHSGFCREPPRSSHDLCRKCLEVSYSISSQGLGYFSRFLLSRSSSHRHKGRWIKLVSASA